MNGAAGVGGSGLPARGSASTWLVVGILGILLFGAGIWGPAWAGLSGGLYFEVALAAAGGSLAMVGFTYFGRARPRARRVRLEDLADGTTVSVLDFRLSPSGAPSGGRPRAEPPSPPDPPEHP